MGTLAKNGLMGYIISCIYIYIYIYIYIFIIYIYIYIIDSIKTVYLGMSGLDEALWYPIQRHI